MDSDEHRRVQELLPWYVTGRLDAAEHDRVQSHVQGCADCQAEVRMEQRLGAEVARLPLDVEHGWATMRRRLEAETRTGRPAHLARLRPAWLGWGVAAALTLALGVSWLPRTQPNGYHALGKAPAQTTGDIVVVFLPDTTERQMRDVLKASQARLADGPTAANGYVLRVPASRREEALATLRAARTVVVAEPVDSGVAP